jgi:hypothetical protein
MVLYLILAILAGGFAFALWLHRRSVSRDPVTSIDSFHQRLGALKPDTKVGGER